MAHLAVVVLDRKVDGVSHIASQPYPVLENHPAPLLQLSQKLRIYVQYSFPGKWQNSLCLPTFVIDRCEVNGLSHIGLSEPSSLTRRQDVGAALFLQIDVSESRDSSPGILCQVLRILAHGPRPGREALFGDGTLDRA